MKKCLLLLLLVIALLCAACGQTSQLPDVTPDPSSQTSCGDTQEPSTQATTENTQVPSTQPTTDTTQNPPVQPTGGTAQEHACDSRCPDCGLCANSGCTEAACAEKCACTQKEDPHAFSQGDYITGGPVSVDTGTLVFDIGANVYVPGYLAQAGEVVATTIEKITGLDFDGAGYARQNFPDGKVHIRVSRDYLYAGQDWFQGLATSELGSAQASAWQHVEMCPGDLLFSNNYTLVHELSHVLMYRQSEWHHSQLLNEGFAEYTTYLTLLELERTNPAIAYHLDKSSHPVANMMLTEQEYAQLFSQPLEYWFENILECGNSNYTIGFRFMAYLQKVYGDYSKWIPAFERTYSFGQKDGDTDVSAAAQQIQVLKATYGADVLDNFYPWLKANRQMFDQSGYESAVTDLTGASQINWYPIFNAIESSVTLEQVKYRELYINLETVKLYLGQYKAVDTSGLYLENPGNISIVCYRQDGSCSVPTKAEKISLEGISYIKLVGEGKLSGLQIKGF